MSASTRSSSRGFVVQKGLAFVEEPLRRLPRCLGDPKEHLDPRAVDSLFESDQVLARCTDGIGHAIMREFGLFPRLTNA